MSAEVFNLEFELVLGSFIGALEGHVFEEMSGSRRLVGFCSGTGVDPNSYGGSGCMGMSFSGDSETIWQSGDLSQRGRDGAGGQSADGGELDERRKGNNRSWQNIEADELVP